MPSERLIEHFQNPRNVGELPPPAVKVDVINPACGDMLRLCARIDGNAIAAVTFKARGCVASIAAASALTELLQGRTRVSLLNLGTGDVESAVGGLDPASKHAAQLCIDAVRQLHASWPTV